MPWNGSGTFERSDGTRTGATVWAQAKAAAVKIVSADHDTHDEDVATAINLCLTHDGQNAVTGKLDMDGKELILDADADTSITADTDDRVDFRAGGQDIVRFDGTTASSVNFFDLASRATGVAPVLKSRGEANVGLVIQDTNGNEALILGSVASAVNELTVTPAATGNDVQIAPTGDDTNIGTRVAGKGTGIPNIASFGYHDVSGRLTLTSGTAVTTSDVTAATTVYFTPHKGDLIALFDGTDKWEWFRFAELSIAVPATTATMYDVFIYDNSGTPTLELTAWTNDTTRATALALQNGVYVKTGATTRRYLGSFRTTGVSGQTEDSLAKRYVWNYYNRVSRPMRVLEGTTSWTYTTATVRQANGAAANQLDFIVGVSEDIVKAYIQAAASNGTGGVSVAVGVGLDVTASMTTGALRGNEATAAGAVKSVLCTYEDYIAVGRHFLSWNEYSQATGTTTWYGIATDATLKQSGIIGEILG